MDAWKRSDAHGLGFDTGRLLEAAEKLYEARDRALGARWDR